MRIIAIILRVLIIGIWVKLLALSGWTPNTAPFCSGIAFISVGIYFAIQAVKWPKATLCPIIYGCKGEPNCKK